MSLSAENAIRLGPKGSYDRIVYLESEVIRLQNWVNDCQKGMYINCVYCGHRYGPDKETPSIMADVLYEHIKICKKHPLSAALSENEKLREERDQIQEKVERLQNETKFKIGSNVIKNPDCWAEYPEFHPWRGEGIGEIVEPPFVLEDDQVDVKWPSGRCFEKTSDLLRVIR